MKPTREIRVVPSNAWDSLARLRSAVKTGGLVALLRGEGLTRGTVEELLKPESAETLRSILNRYVFSGGEKFNPCPEIVSGRCKPGEGKVLVFRRKGTSGP